MYVHSTYLLKCVLQYYCTALVSSSTTCSSVVSYSLNTHYTHILTPTMSCVCCYCYFKSTTRGMLGAGTKFSRKVSYLRRAAVVDMRSLSMRTCWSSVISLSYSSSICLRFLRFNASTACSISTSRI